MGNSRNGRPFFRDWFTLIELLIVIVILAILIALLLPALGKARDVAKQVICQGNTRSLGALFLGYANENMGYPPQGEYVRPLSPAYWMDTFAIDYHAPKYTYDLRDRVKPENTVWYCPSHPMERYKASNLKTSYGYNYWAMNLGYTIPLRRVDFFKRPSMTFWVAENFSHREASPCGGVPGKYLTDADTINLNVVAYRHNKKASYTFFDGHAETRGMQQSPTVQFYSSVSADILRNTWFVSGAPTVQDTFLGY